MGIPFLTKILAILFYFTLAPEARSAATPKQTKESVKETPRKVIKIEAALRWNPDYACKTSWLPDLNFGTKAYAEIPPRYQIHWYKGIKINHEKKSLKVTYYEFEGIPRKCYRPSVRVYKEAIYQKLVKLTSKKWLMCPLPEKKKCLGCTGPATVRIQIFFEDGSKVIGHPLDPLGPASLSHQLCDAELDRMITAL